MATHKRHKGIGKGHGANATPPENDPLELLADIGLQHPLPNAQRLGSPFGMRIHPKQGKLKLHAGMDLPAPEGTKILAAADGVVESLGWNGGYGNQVTIRHSERVSTRYGHMLKAEKGLKVGGPVEAGQVIGGVGSTGESTGNHLHYEVRVDGKAIDPRLAQDLSLNPRRMLASARTRGKRNEEQNEGRPVEVLQSLDDLTTQGRAFEDRISRADLYGTRDPRVGLICRLGKKLGYGHLVRGKEGPSNPKWDASVDRLLTAYARDHHIPWKPGRREPTAVLAAMREEWADKSTADRRPQRSTYADAELEGAEFFPQAASPTVGDSDARRHIASKILPSEQGTSHPKAAPRTDVASWWTGEAGKIGESSPEVKKLQELARAAGYWNPLDGEPQEKWGYSTTQMLQKVAQAHQIDWREGEDVRPLILSMQNELTHEVSSVFGAVSKRRAAPSVSHAFENLSKGKASLPVSSRETPEMKRIQMALQVVGYYPMPDDTYSQRAINMGLEGFADSHGMKHTPGAVSKKLLRALGEEADTQLRSLQSPQQPSRSPREHRPPEIS